MFIKENILEPEIMIDIQTFKNYILTDLYDKMNI